MHHTVASASNHPAIANAAGLGVQQRPGQSTGISRFLKVKENRHDASFGSPHTHRYMFLRLLQVANSAEYYRVSWAFGWLFHRR